MNTALAIADNDRFFAEHKVIPAFQSLSYTSAHRRLLRARGRARDYRCMDCNGPALQWSYRGGADDEQTGTTRMKHYRSGRVYQVRVKWSSNVLDYEPRCRPCHQAYDKAARA